VTRAFARGAKVAVMPSLACMTQVTDRGLTFKDAMDGRPGRGQGPLALFDRLRVNQWWSQDVPAFFDKFPREWLPLPRSMTASVPSGGSE